jgi:hypothetical protein
VSIAIWPIEFRNDRGIRLALNHFGRQTGELVDTHYLKD